MQREYDTTQSEAQTADPLQERGAYAWSKATRATEAFSLCEGRMLPELSPNLRPEPPILS